MTPQAHSRRRGRDALRELASALRPCGVGRQVARTASYNVASAAAASLRGTVVARALEPEMRGEYAAVTTWFVGGLYLYGGWLPMLAGMFLLCFVVRLLDDQLDVRANRHGIFLVLLLLSQLVTSEGDWGPLCRRFPRLRSCGCSPLS